MSITSEIINSTKTGQAKALQKNAKKYTDSLTQITTQQNKELTKATNKQIEGTRQAVQRSYDLNALNEEIQAQQVSDRMASLGLTDSGLNLTQQTALASSRINADAQVSQSYNNAVAVLRSNLQTAIAENNRTLQANVAQVNYNTGADVATIKSGLKTGAKQTAQSLISAITSTTDKATQAQVIFSASQTYGLSQASVDRLLAMTNISKKEYQAFLNDREYFLKKASSLTNPGVKEPDNNPGKKAFDYSKWSASQWYQYFDTIRTAQGEDAAEQELQKFMDEGLLPDSVVTEIVAQAGASGFEESLKPAWERIKDYFSSSGKK